MDITTLHQHAVEAWAARLAQVPADRWDAPTPCADWTVRDLVQHVANEDCWTVALLAGETIEQVGGRYDGDLLGDDPVGAGTAAADDARRAVAERVPEGGTVHLSYGEEQVDEYVMQLVTDHLVHTWDLAVATGGDARLEPSLVRVVADWFAEREDLYRGAGMIAARGHLPGDGGLGDLVAAFGRDPHWGPNHSLLVRFSAAFGSGDVDGIMALMTDDCHFESTGPAPDGVPHDGAADVRQVWVDLFGGTPDATFDEEESFVAGDRGVLRWRFSWSNEDGSPGHVRGVDVMRFRDGKVSEKLSYVKG